MYLYRSLVWPAHCLSVSLCNLLTCLQMKSMATSIHSTRSDPHGESECTSTDCVTCRQVSFWLSMKQYKKACSGSQDLCSADITSGDDPFVDSRWSFAIRSTSHETECLNLMNNNLHAITGLACLPPASTYCISSRARFRSHFNYCRRMVMTSVKCNKFSPSCRIKRERERESTLSRYFR